MEKRLKKLTVSQIRKVYCKMMKTKQTKLKKKDIISKLLKPLKRKYRVMALVTTKEGKRMPENVVGYFNQFLTPQDRGRQLSLNKGVSDPLKNLPHTDPNKYPLIESKMKHLEDAQRTLNKFDNYNMKAIEKKYGLYSNQLSTPRLFIVALIIRKKLLVKKNRTVLENIFDVMSINSKRNAGYKYSIYDIFAEAIRMLSDSQLLINLKRRHPEFNILDLIKILIDRVNVNKQIDNEVGHYTTPLKMASEKGHLELVKILLKHGADINLTTGDYGYTALMFASKYDHRKIVKILLENGADVNIQNRNGFTALIFASEHTNVQVVKMLLDYKADVNIQENNGDTALTTSICHEKPGTITIVELLLEHGADVNLTIGGYTNYSALMSASRRGFSKIVKMLLEHGADVNALSNFGKTALMLTTDPIRGNDDDRAKTVKILLDYKADVNIQNNENGSTALMIASRFGYSTIVKMLLEHGADVNEKDNNGSTALILSVINDNVETVKMLLDNKADVNIQSNSGSTALIYAADSDDESSEKIVKMLLDHGADVHIKNNRNKKAIDFTYNTRNDGKKMLILAKMH